MDVQFDESNQVPIPRAAGPSGLIGFVIRSGLAKDEADAQKVLLITFGCALTAMTIVFLVSSMGNSSPPQPPPEALIGVTERL